MKERFKAIDATHIIAYVAIPDTTKLSKEERQRVLGAIKEETKGLKEFLKRYLPQEEKSSPKLIKEEELAKELNLSKELTKKVKGKCVNLDDLVRFINKLNII